MDVREWFLEHVAGFEPLPPFLALKRDHSLRVASNSRALAEALGWEPPLVELAEACGLLHDIGRFAQYRDFDTVHDGPSDHGESGYEVLVSTFPWERVDLDPDPILDTARYHNKRDIPPCAPASLPFLKLVRDADKIDILEVIQAYVIQDRVDEIYPGIDPRGAPDPDLVSHVLARSRAPSEHADSVADLMLVKLTWVYDINFAPSLRHLEMTGILDWMISRLPPGPGIDRIAATIRDHVRARLEDAGA
jgi:putative nucleotidyltransferase with HDIG domain